MEKERINEKLVVYKPNQTIMLTNGEITSTQRKAYNVILHKAWNDLKIDSRQSVFKFGLKEIKDMAGIKSTENWQLKRDISKISDIRVETVFDNGDWSIFSLVSSARKKGDFLEIELPIQIREALLENNFYTTLDMMTIKGLEGKYSVLLYEMAIRYQKAQIPEMTIEEFRRLTGIENKKGYNNFNNIEKKILAPALEEINSDKTDIYLSYTTTSRGKKTISIKFSVKTKTKRKETSATNEISATKEQLTIDDAIAVESKKEIDKILEPLEVDAEELTKYVNDIDIEILKEYVAVIQKNKDDARTKIGTLIYAFKHQMTPESVSAMIKASKKKPSNREFEEREYSEEYYESFFNNNK